MPVFFPRTKLDLRLEEPKAFRRVSFSLVEMALVTGVVARLYRVTVLTHGTTHWLYLVGVFTVWAVFMLGMLTAHLANYPPREYLWRAPAFAGLVVVGEMAMSALLIWVGREANGTVRAHWDDWPSMALRALLIRGLVVIAWGYLLAGVLWLVHRSGVVKEDP
jgi:hypothetical protein